MSNLNLLQQRASRQVTSLSYDLVDSSGQMVVLGVESYALWLERIHLAYKAIVTRWDGIVDVAQGDDGCMCYFGAVISAEYARESALFAAIEMRDLALASGWEIRFGVAYGVSSVNQDQPYGPSVHLAARLQKLALGCQILVSSDLAEVVQHKFELTELITLPEIKGFSIGQRAGQLLAKKGLMLTQPVITPNRIKKLHQYLIGRQQMLMNLKQCWANVQKKQGQDVCLVGEAGIGKTTLVNTFIDSLNGPVKLVFSLRFFPEDRHIPFAPLTNILSNWLKLSLLDTVAERERKLKARSDQLGWSEQHIWAIRHLTGLKHAGLTSLLEDSLSHQHQLIEVMVDWVKDISLHQAILIVFEDYQWTDAATCLFLENLQSQIDGSAIMLLVTQRSNDASAAKTNVYTPRHHRFEIEPLTFEESAALIDRIGADLNLDLEMSALLQTRSQGVPLLIEESIKLLRKPDAQLKLRTAKNLNLGFPVPSSVQELFMHKLDNLGASRALAQVCSALSTEFNQILMNAVMRDFAPDLADDTVSSMMEVLLSEGVLCVRGVASEQVYYFKHALIQDTAYQSMWDTDKKKLHGSIAHVFETEFSQMTVMQPHVIGRHYFLANQNELALHYSLQAADLYKSGGNHISCISVLEMALACVDLLTSDESVMRTQVSIRLKLAGQVLLTQGYGDQLVAESFADALRLGKTLNDGSVIFKSYLGLHSYFLMRGNFDEADQQLALAQSSPLFESQELNHLLCDFAQAMGCFYRGHIQATTELMASCELQAHQLVQAAKLTHNPSVLSTVYRAFCLWILGHTEQALHVMTEGVAATNGRANKLAAVQAMGIQSMLLYCRGDYLLALDCAKGAVAIGHDGQYALWLDLARFMQGAARVQLAVQEEKSPTEVQDALSQMVKAYEDWVSKSAVLTQTFYLCVLAQIHMLLLDYEEANKRLDRALQLMEQHGERYYAPEILRTCAELSIKSRNSQDWLLNAKALLNAAHLEASDKGLHSFVVRVALTMYDCERAAGQACVWLGTEQTTLHVLAQSLALIESDSTTQDARRCRQVIAAYTSLPFIST